MGKSIGFAFRKRDTLFETRVSQTNDRHDVYLAGHSALLEQAQHWFAQHKDKSTEQDIRLLC